MDDFFLLIADAEKEDDEEETIDSPGDGALRLMTWNLDGLSVEKAANPGVVDVVAGILTRFHISVAVFHGVSQAPALQLVRFFYFVIFPFFHRFLFRSVD